MEHTGSDFRMVTVGHIKEVVSVIGLPCKKMIKTGSCNNDMTTWQGSAEPTTSQPAIFWAQMLYSKRSQRFIKEIFLLYIKHQ